MVQMSAATILFILNLSIVVASKASKVSIKGQQVLLDGKPYKIKGVGLNNASQFDLLKMIGANTVRTYGGPETEAVLEAALEKGFKVIAGLWIRPTYQGLDYTNATAVEEELATAVTPFVKKYRTHPALLFWGVGNEMENGVDPSQWDMIWAVLEQAAKIVHELDPDHPTMGVLAEVANDKATSFGAAVPSIDILGVNSYGQGVINVQQRVRTQNWTGPLLITEFGPIGQWQVNLTSWGAAPEPSSDEKADILSGQMKALKNQKQDALPFYWGNKFEATYTWHGLLLPAPKREYLRSVEVIAANWGGRVPNCAPRLQANWTNTNNKWNTFQLGENGTVKLIAIDPDHDRIGMNFTVAAESDTIYGTTDTAIYANVVTAINGTVATIVTSRLDAGNYRLYITAKDGKGAAATTNLPFQVIS